MSLLAMLKKGSLRQPATAIPATFATVAPPTTPKVATVATVAVAKAEKVAANDPAPTITVLAMPPADSASGAVIDIGTIRPPGLSAKLLAASMALDAQIHAAGALPGNDPDTDCWPHSTAMTGSEIDLFAARLARFTTKGVIHGDAELLADRLVIRDLVDGDRALCLECSHLGGYGRTSWRCGNWQAAGVAIRPRDTQLPADLVLRLQCCDGFSPHHTSTPQRNDYEHDRH